MHYIIACCLVLFFGVFAYGKSDFIRVPEEYTPEILKAVIDCSASGGNSDIIEKLMNWKIEDTDSFRESLYCFLTTAGYADGDGYIVEEKMAKLVGDHKRKEEYLTAMRECNKLVAADKYDRLYKYVFCFHDTSPYLLKL